MRETKFWLTCLVALLAGFALNCHGANPEIAVFKSRDVVPYNAAAAGFRKSLEEKGITPELTVYDMQGSEEEGARICEEIKSRNPALVLTLGSEATRAAQERINIIPSKNCPGFSETYPAALTSSGLLLTAPSIRKTR